MFFVSFTIFENILKWYYKWYTCSTLTPVRNEPSKSNKYMLKKENKNLVFRIIFFYYLNFLRRLQKQKSLKLSISTMVSTRMYSLKMRHEINLTVFILLLINKIKLSTTFWVALRVWRGVAPVTEPVAAAVCLRSQCVPGGDETLEIGRMIKICLV